MGNPVSAFKNSKCDSCDYEFDEGEDFYLTDDGKLCEKCAGEYDYLCECGNFKKPNFEKCYDCKWYDCFEEERKVDNE